ncbi:MAG: polymer-forming cytoskeletal protein [Gammaproteobacteria bacterium]|nr:polymer-forming cytoskeletal protein [Gammaproteobacteria bacterium]
MLRSRKRKQPAIGTLIGGGARVHGDIEFAGGIHIDGFVKGNVVAADEPGSSVSISERGCVEGTVSAAQVLLNGTVNGDVLAAERVELGPRARVIGNVRYSLIEMAVGAEVNGKLIHDSERRAVEETADAGDGPLQSVDAVVE